MSLVSHTHHLPSDTPVLVSALMVGHKPIDGQPKCHTTAPVHESTAKAAYAYGVAVCVECWGVSTAW